MTTQNRNPRNAGAKPTVWKNGGRSNMRTIQVPAGVKKMTHEIAQVLDHESEFQIRLQKIKEILRQDQG